MSLVVVIVGALLATHMLSDVAFNYKRGRTTLASFELVSAILYIVAASCGMWNIFGSLINAFK